MNLNESYRVGTNSFILQYALYRKLTIQIIEINDTEIMVINEEGKLENLPLNEQATAIYQKQVCEGDFIVGDVLICKNEEVR